MDDPQISNSQKKNTTMAELFAGSSGMAVANQLTPHPREVMRKGLTEGSVTGYYIIMPTGREKN
jgi:hypothetical protein